MKRRGFLAASAAALAAPSVRAQPAKVIKFAPQADLALLDPHFAPALVTRNHAYLVFDTLYGVDDEAKPHPQMAAGHVVEDNGLTWKITLRDGLKFHDGTPVLARDCVASLKRWAQRDVYAISVWGQVEEVSAPSDKVIQFRLKRPFRLLADMLGKQNPFAPVIMPERLASTPPAQQISEVIGSGPFRYLMNERVPGSRNVYERWPGYVPRQEPAVGSTGGKVVHVDRVEWHTLPDPATAAAALQSGEIDWLEQPLADLVPTLQRNRNIEVGVLNPTGLMSIMRLNHLQAPFNNLRVRQAVALAVDQADYMRSTLGDDRSIWQECRSLFPCGTPYGVENLSELNAPPRSLDRARAALQASGYNGEKVVIINPTDFPLIGPHGQVTADRLRRIGMNVELAETDWGTVVQRRVRTEPADRGGWSIFHTYGSSLAYLNPAVSSLVKGPGATGWFGWYNSPAMQERIQAWFDAPDAARQKALADEINKLAQDDVATIPLGQFRIRSAWRRSITGLAQGSMPYPWGVRPAG